MCLGKHVHDIIVETACSDTVRENVSLRITSDPTYYRFAYSLNGDTWTELDLVLWLVCAQKRQEL